LLPSLKQRPPISTEYSSAAAQKWWKTVSERPLWAKTNNMDTSLAAPWFRIEPGGHRSFEGHNNPLVGEGEHNKTADCTTRASTRTRWWQIFVRDATSTAKGVIHQDNYSNIIFWRTWIVGGDKAITS
jgi:hypothetical protein